MGAKLVLQASVLRSTYIPSPGGFLAQHSKVRDVHENCCGKSVINPRSLVSCKGSAGTNLSVKFSFPPRRMRIDAACYYLGVSEQTFRDRVKAGIYPPGLREGGVRFWLRDDLDAYIDRQFTVSGSPANDRARDIDPFSARFSKAS